MRAVRAVRVRARACEPWVSRSPVCKSSSRTRQTRGEQARIWTIGTADHIANDGHALHRRAVRVVGVHLRDGRRQLVQRDVVRAAVLESQEPEVLHQCEEVARLVLGEVRGDAEVRVGAGPAAPPQAREQVVVVRDEQRGVRAQHDGHRVGGHVLGELVVGHGVEVARLGSSS